MHAGERLGQFVAASQWEALPHAVRQRLPLRCRNKLAETFTGMHASNPPAIKFLSGRICPVLRRCP